jgi:hypothetical protein
LILGIALLKGAWATKYMTLCSKILVILYLAVFNSLVRYAVETFGIGVDGVDSKRLPGLCCVCIRLVRKAITFPVDNVKNWPLPEYFLKTRLF